jgi:hypothetical protein
MRAIVERMEALLDSAGGPGMLFDADRADAADRAIKVSAVDAAATAGPLWIVGDLHGDLLALEAALALVRDHASRCGGARPRLVLLGDLFDDEGFGLEVLLRVFELIVEAPELVCVLAGNHDEALSYDGARFGSSVAPSDLRTSSTRTSRTSGSSAPASWRCGCSRRRRGRCSSRTGCWWRTGASR